MKKFATFLVDIFHDIAIRSPGTFNTSWSTPNGNTVDQKSCLKLLQTGAEPGDTVFDFRWKTTKGFCIITLSCMS